MQDKGSAEETYTTKATQTAPQKTMPPSQNPPRRSKILKRYNTELHTMVQANIYTKKHIYFYVEVLNFTYHLQIHSQKEFFYL